MPAVRHGRQLARIPPNTPSQRAQWCNLSLSKDVMFKSPLRETFSMDTRRSLRRVIVRTSGSAGSARRDRSAGRGRGQAARGILVPALVLGTSAGAMATATPAYAIGSQATAGAHQAAASLVIQARADSARACMARHAPEIALTPQTVWIYVLPNRTLAMSAAIGQLPSAHRASPGARAGACGPAGPAAR